MNWGKKAEADSLRTWGHIVIIGHVRLHIVKLLKEEVGANLQRMADSLALINRALTHHESDEGDMD